LAILEANWLSLMGRWSALTDHDEEEGQSMIEYGLIVALISIVAIVTLSTVGGNITDVFNSVAGKMHS
jgi:pilus assembly protein Flp/PilA